LFSTFDPNVADANTNNFEMSSFVGERGVLLEIKII
jgi:hypothetical protein